MSGHTESRRKPPCPGVVCEEQPTTAVGPDHRWYWNESAWRWECWDCPAYSPRKLDPPLPDELVSGEPK